MNLLFLCLFSTYQTGPNVRLGRHIILFIYLHFVSYCLILLYCIYVFTSGLQMEISLHAVLYKWNKQNCCFHHLFVMLCSSVCVCVCSCYPELIGTGNLSVMHMNQCRIMWKPGAQYFAKGHCMQTVGSRDRTTNLPISGQPLRRMSPSSVHTCGRAYVCVYVCTWTPTVVAAHCTAVIWGLTDTWDQWRRSSEEAAAWQLALITFSTLRNSTLYMPLTGARTVILTQPCR